MIKLELYFNFILTLGVYLTQGSQVCEMQFSWHGVTAWSEFLCVTVDDHSEKMQEVILKRYWLCQASVGIHILTF